jgi:hypothetical protein
MKPWFYILLILFCCSCTEPSRLETALRQSGANRPELEKVLAHYAGDSLKYRAACFLIEHMPGKYSLEPERGDDPYRNFLRHIPATDSINWKLDSCHVGHLLDSVAISVCSVVVRLIIVLVMVVDCMMVQFIIK